MRIAVLVVLLAGCSTRYDFSGTYTGTVTRNGERSRTVTDLQPDGTLTADTNRFSDNASGTRITIRQLDESHLEADLGGGCRVRLDQSPSPNEHSAVVANVPAQYCRIDVQGVTGNVLFSGSASFTRDAPYGLTLTFNGGEQTGNPDRAGATNLRYTYGFQGQREGD